MMRTASRPRLTLVICTYNRADSLQVTLESVAKQTLGRDFFDLLIVDNNSTDRTKHMVQNFFAGNKDLQGRYLFESQQGLSHARNRAVRESQGRFVLFTDDDVVIDPHWAESIYRCFEETGADAVGGKIERLWNCDKPAWFKEEIGGALIHQNLGDQRCAWPSKTQHMVGANMAFRKSVLEELGPFCTELGRTGDSLIGGEDREYFLRLVRHRKKIFYDPQAIIFHRVEAERLTQEYFTRWFTEIGTTLGHGIEKRWHYAFTVAPLWLWNNFIKSVFRRLSAVMSCKTLDPSEFFASQLWLQHYKAMLRERWIHWLPSIRSNSQCGFGRLIKN